MLSCLKFLTQAKARFIFQVILSWHIVILGFVLILSSFFIDQSLSEQNLITGLSILIPLSSYWLSAESHQNRKEKEVEKIQRYFKLAKRLHLNGVHIDYQKMDLTGKEKNFYNPPFGQGRFIFIQQCLFSLFIFYGSCTAIFLPYILDPSRISMYQTSGFYSILFLLGSWFGKPKIEKEKKYQKSENILFYFLDKIPKENLSKRDIKKLFDDGIFG